MSELLHRIRVFVYRMSGIKPTYLLLRSDQGIEGFWVPVHGSIQFGEQLESAIHREVRSDTGLVRPMDVIDLEMPSRMVVGDEHVIEWNFGFRALPDAERLCLDPRFCDFRWADFSAAYPSLEMEADRAAIMRLHTLLSAA